MENSVSRVERFLVVHQSRRTDMKSGGLQRAVGTCPVDNDVHRAMCCGVIIDSVENLSTVAHQLRN